MSVLCKSCSHDVDGRSYLVCKKCKNYYHVECAGKRTEKLHELSENEIESWICKLCCENPIQHLAEKLDPKDNLTFEQKFDILFRMVEQINQQMPVIVGLQSKIKSLEKENCRMSQENSEIKGRLDLLEQRSRLNNLEITGIPVMDKEDPRKLVTEVFKAYGINVPSEVIDVVHRVPTRNIKQPKPVIVALNGRYWKNKILESVKTNVKSRNIITVDQIFPEYKGKDKIFVREHLTANNKFLLNECKKVAKDKNYKFVWVRDCKICVRKNEQAAIKVIYSLSDVHTL